MRVHVVSDVHGRHEALREAADGADALLCLGDLLLFLDYADHGQGIFPELFGAEAAGQFIALRTAQRFDEARAMSARLWSRLDGDPVARLEEVVSRQYEELFAAPRGAALRSDAPAGQDSQGRHRAQKRTRHHVGRLRADADWRARLSHAND